MNTAIRVVVSVLLLGLLFAYVVDLREVLRILATFDLRYLLLAVLVVNADRALMAYKWILLLKTQGHRLSMVDGMAIYCSSMLWGAVLPSTLGADAIRAVLVMRRGNISGNDVVASIVVERMLGFVTALLLAIGSLAILRYAGLLHAQFDRALFVCAAALVGTIGLLIVSMNATITNRLVSLLPGVIRDSKPMKLLLRLADAYRSLGAARSTLALFVVLSFIEQFFSTAMTWVLALGLSVQVDALVLLGVVPLAILVSRLPVTIDGLGVYEVIFAGLLALAGVSPEAALAIAFSGRIVQWLCFMPWWLVQVLRSGQLRPPAPVAPPVGETARSALSGNP